MESGTLRVDVGKGVEPMGQNFLGRRGAASNKGLVEQPQ